MVDLYLDTFRDLSKGKTNKLNRQGSQILMFERDKEIEVEELPSGGVQLSNVQKVKLANSKEAAMFIEKSVSASLDKSCQLQLCIVGLSKEVGARQQDVRQLDSYLLHYKPNLRGWNFIINLLR